MYTQNMNSGPLTVSDTVLPLTTTMPTFAITKKLNHMTTHMPNVAEAIFKIHGNIPPHASLSSYKNRVQELAQNHNQMMKTTSQTFGEIASCSEQMSNFLQSFLGAGISIEDMVEALQTAKEDAQKIEGEVKHTIRSVTGLKDVMKSIAQEYSTREESLQDGNSRDEGDKRPMIENGRGKIYGVGCGVMGMAAITGVSICTGAASMIPGALVLVCVALCITKSNSSTEFKNDDDEACQSDEWANQNKTTALQASISLQDTAHQLALFATFWHSHIQDLDNKIKMLQTLNDKSVLIHNLDKAKVDIAVKEWHDFSVKMKYYRGVITRVSVAGIIDA